MLQAWRDLLFLHWRWDPGELRSRLPRGIELDTVEGQAWLGLVAFRIEGLRYRWLPRWLSLDFPELNVRTYVVDGRGTPGVWFFSLDAASSLAVAGGRRLYSLPYYGSRMSVRWDADGFLELGSRRRERPEPTAWYRSRGLGSPRRAEPRSLEHFLVERYFLFTVRRGQLARARVQHRPYPIEHAELSQWSAWPLVLDAFATPRREPDSMLYSRGVDVQVGSLERVPGS